MARRHKANNNPRCIPRIRQLLKPSRVGNCRWLFNHYYLEKFKQENPNAPVAHHFTDDVGSLVNVAGVAILNSANHPQIAQKFVDFMLETGSEILCHQNL